MTLPLHNSLVIELGTMVTAPLAGMLLADMGARVIKVELPVTGDPFRGHGGGSYSPPFVAYNRGKESIQLDLRSEAGRADLTLLLAQADVLIENFRPGVLERMGFTPAKLAAINPRLIRATITGFGKDGPYAERPSYDSVTMALSGMSSLLLDEQDPQVSGPTIADNVTGMYAAQAILAALFGRAKSGIGAHVEVNMLEASLAFIPDAFAQYARAGLVSGPQTRVAISQSYALICADGEKLAVHISSVEKFWQGLLSAIERPDLAQDPRFARAADRTKHYPALRALLLEIFAQQPRALWLEKLAAAEVPFAPIYAIDQVQQDEQIQHLQSFVTVDHPVKGPVNMVKSPIRINGLRQDQPKAPPELNADAAALAAEFKLSIAL